MVPSQDGQAGLSETTRAVLDTSEKIVSQDKSRLDDASAC